MTAVTFRQATSADVNQCYDIEIASYEGDEAATREKIATRINNYPQGFLCMECDGELAGFINAGCAWEVKMSDEEFKELVGHDAAAPNVVIMSVVVHPDYQGRKLSTLMMQKFVTLMKNMGKETIHLMCKERHVELYKGFGFRYVQPSASDHGGMAWHEMEMTLI